jgi:hypothetical protein
MSVMRHNHAVQNRLSLHLLSKNIKIKIYTIIFLLFCKGVKHDFSSYGKNTDLGGLRRGC